MASMKASVVMGSLAFVVLVLSTSAYANDTELVRRKLMLLGYDQIEFVQNKPPFEVNACRGTKRLRLHVDSYRRITRKTLTGPCTSEARATEEPKTRTFNTAECKRFFPSIGKTLTVACVETEEKPKDDSEATRNVGCKRFFPSIGKTLTVACE